jgi:adenylate kinase
MDLVLLGIQGSGKGTQAKRLAAEFGFAIFEAGGQLRAIAASDTPLGATVRSYIDAGNLVPHEIIMEVVRTAIAKYPASQRLLFDGVPRDLDQMRDFDAIMREQNRDFRCVHLLLDSNVGVTRILGRAKAEGRSDDASEEPIRRRMNIFQEKTMPVIEQYAAKGRVTRVEADHPVDVVFEELKEIVKGM